MNGQAGCESQVLDLSTSLEVTVGQTSYVAPLPVFNRVSPVGGMAVPIYLPTRTAPDFARSGVGPAPGMSVGRFETCPYSRTIWRHRPRFFAESILSEAEGLRMTVVGVSGSD